MAPLFKNKHFWRRRIWRSCCTFLILSASTSFSFPAIADSQALLVAPRNTPVFLRPDLGAPRALPGSDRSALKYVVFEDHGAVEGGFRAVGLNTNEGCHSNWGTVNLKARFYIRADSITTVTTRPLLLKFADDTGARLSAGIAVSPGRGPNHRTVHLADATVQVPVALIPQAALGTSYIESEATGKALDLPSHDGFEDGYPDDLYVLLPGAKARLGGLPMRAPGPQPVSTDQRMRVTWSSGCFEVIARAPRKAVTTMTAAQYERRWGVPQDEPDNPNAACSIEVTDFRLGTSYTNVAQAYLPSGEAIGTVDSCLTLGRETAPAGSRRCFFIYLDGPRPGAKPMRLCFDAAAIRFLP